MSAITKKMHVHFTDELLNASSMPNTANEEVSGLQDKLANLSYSRNELLMLRNCAIAKEPPILFDEMNEESELKRREKFISLMRPAKNRSINKVEAVTNTDENGNSVSLLPAFANKKKNDLELANKTPTAKERVNFEQLMASATSENSSFMENMKQREILWRGANQRSGNRNRQSHSWDSRDLNGNAKESSLAYEMGNDYRYMNNDLFDKRMGSITKTNNANNKVEIRNQFGREFSWNKNRYNGRHNPMMHPGHFYGNRSKESEPEWMTGGPTSQDDVIDLHGFDDSVDKELEKWKVSGNLDKLTDGDGKNVRNSPPAKSTPAKLMANNSKKDPTVGVKSTDENFNFEEFLKLDFPSNCNSSKGVENGESRFTRWFRREIPSKIPSNKSSKEDLSSAASADQFFDLVQKSKLNKPPSNLVSMSSKFRSVEELEADLCAKNRVGRNNNATSGNEAGSFRKHMHPSNPTKNMPLSQSQQMNLQEILNKNAYDILQYQLVQDQILRRNEAQIILHRLACNEISLWHVLQQLGNPSISIYDRETLMAVINFCNGNNRMQSLKQKQQHQQQLNVVQQLRNWQLNASPGQNSCPPRPPTPQELQVHTQNIMRSALLKKQLEDQYRLQQQSTFSGGEAGPSNFSPTYLRNNGNGGFMPNDNYMQRYQQFNNQPFPHNPFKFRHNGRNTFKPPNFPAQQQQGYQMMHQTPKQAFGRKLSSQQHNNSFTLSANVPEKKWTVPSTLPTESNSNNSGAMLDVPSTAVKLPAENQTPINEHTNALINTSNEAEK